MPIKILLADKSITIQKVVEMLFSGKEYEIACVSDGETGLKETERFRPDVVLADIDLPRIDGYDFAGRLKRIAAFAETPVILMLSRDDVFDQARARSVSILDHIAKPFESQELIAKVKRAVSIAPPRLPEPLSEPVVTSSVPPEETEPSESSIPWFASAEPMPASPIEAPPDDIFDIIADAPSNKEIKQPGPPRAIEAEGVFEVEPMIEVEEPLAGELEHALPVGEKAVEEIRAGLGLEAQTFEVEPEIVNFETLDIANQSREEFMMAEEERPASPAQSVEPLLQEPEAPFNNETRGLWREPPAGAAGFMPPLDEAREYVPPPSDTEYIAPETLSSEERVRTITDEVIVKTAHDYFKNMPPVQVPKVSEATIQKAIEEAVAKIVRETAHEVIEKVAWEVIPDLAEKLIKAEIRRLKTET